MKPGIYKIDDDKYHKGPGVSNSMLKVFREQTPYDYHYQFNLGNRPEPTRNMKFGTDIHEAVFERDKFDSKTMIGPVDDKRLKEWKDFEKATIKSGLIPITPAYFEIINKIRESVYKFAGNLICDGDAEMSCYSIEKELNTLKRCKYDFFNKKLNTLIDLKKSTSANPAHFYHSIMKYGYHIANAYYQDVLEDLGIHIEAFVFIVVEATPPYKVSINTLDKGFIEHGRQTYKKNLLDLEEHIAKDYWPSYEDIYSIDQFGNVDNYKK